MLLPINPERIEKAPLMPPVPVGAAIAAASAGQGEALADWLVSSLRRQAYRDTKDKNLADKTLRSLFSRISVRVEFR